MSPRRQDNPSTDLQQTGLERRKDLHVHISRPPLRRNHDEHCALSTVPTTRLVGTQPAKPNHSNCNPHNTIHQRAVRQVGSKSFAWTMAIILVQIGLMNTGDAKLSPNQYYKRWRHFRFMSVAERLLIAVRVALRTPWLVKRGDCGNGSALSVPL